MFHFRERIVVVMQELFPFLVLGRAAKPFRVIGQGLPSHQENVTGRFFYTSIELMTDVSLHRSNDSLCFLKRCLERRLLTGFDIENGKPGQDGVFRD